MKNTNGSLQFIPGRRGRNEIQKKSEDYFTAKKSEDHEVGLC